MVAFVNHAHLAERLSALRSLDQCSELAHRNHSLLQLALPDRAFLIDQQIMPLRFVLVAWKFRTAREAFGMLAPLIHGLEEANPSLMELQEDLVAHFARKGLIGFMLLH